MSWEMRKENLRDFMCGYLNEQLSLRKMAIVYQDYNGFDVLLLLKFYSLIFEGVSSFETSYRLMFDGHKIRSMTDGGNSNSKVIRRPKLLQLTRWLPFPFLRSWVSQAPPVESAISTSGSASVLFFQSRSQRRTVQVTCDGMKLVAYRPDVFGYFEPLSQ